MPSKSGMSLGQLKEDFGYIQSRVSELKTPHFVPWLSKERTKVTDLEKKVASFQKKINEYSANTIDSKEAQGIVALCKQVNDKLTTIAPKPLQAQKKIWQVLINFFRPLFGTYTPNLEVHAESIEQKINALTSKKFSYEKFINTCSSTYDDPDLSVFKDADLTGCWRIVYNGKRERAWDYMKSWVGYQDIPYTFEQVLKVVNDKSETEYIIKKYSVTSDCSTQLQLHPLDQKDKVIELKFSDFFKSFAPDKNLDDTITEFQKSVFQSDRLRTIPLKDKGAVLLKKFDEESKQLSWQVKLLANQMVRPRIESAKNKSKDWNEFAAKINHIKKSVKEKATTYHSLLSTQDLEILDSLDGKVQEFIDAYAP